jgi:signal transduction histidine kinase
MIQIIDVSSKILYSEIKAEQQFVTLISAAVSHELRNPLNSLIGQINSMDEYFINFTYLNMLLKNENIPDGKFRKIQKGLDKVCEGLKTCGKKMTNSAKFIDYFVHDILDFSILTRPDTRFVKDL